MRQVFFERSGEPLRGIALEQQVLGEDDRHAPRFCVRRSFKYVDDERDEKVVVPDDFETDLASVPWAIWWLVAPYGRHTAAAIVHDVLIGDDTGVPARVRADALFLRALEASGTGWFRRRLMFVGVCVGGTMKRRRPGLELLFFGHVVLFWVAVVAVAVAPRHALAALAALLLALAGFAWPLTRAVAWPQGAWLWPAAALGAPFVAPPVALNALSAEIASCIDWVGARVAGESAPWHHGPWFRVPGALRPQAATQITSASAPDEP